MYLTIFFICAALFLNPHTHVMQRPLTWANPPEIQIRIDGLSPPTPAPNTSAGVLSRQESDKSDRYIPSEVGSFGRNLMDTSSQVSNLRGLITQKNDEIQALLNGRDPDDLQGSEAERLTHLFSEVQVLDVRASNLQMLQPTSRPILDLGFEGGNYAGGKGKVFRNFGDQLQSVYKAGRQGVIDSRLMQVRAASGLSETIPSDSGFLVEPDFSRDIIQSAFSGGNSIARLIKTIPLQSNGIKINAIAETSRVTGSRWGGAQTYWSAEAGTITPSAPKFRRMELSLKKMVMLAYATDELLEDATLLDQTLRTIFASEIAWTLDEAILAGTGVGQPLGIMNSACLVAVTRNTAATIVIGDITGIWARSTSPENSVWLASSTILPTLFSMALTIGNAGVPVFMPAGGLSGAPYNSLLGRPILITEHNQILGVKGDLVLFNPAWYVLAVKSSGLRIDTSMHVRFVNDENCYRGIMRVDGQPALNSPITPAKGTLTLSPFVCLTT
jgi:HK97 family phage major capsid protein